MKTMGSIHNIDFVAFDGNGILYEHGNKWHFEIPVLNIYVCGETPAEVRELALERTRKDNASTFTKRIAALHDELKAPVKTKKK